MKKGQYLVRKHETTYLVNDRETAYRLSAYLRGMVVGVTAAVITTVNNTLVSAEVSDESVSVGELIDANLGFSIRSTESPFDDNGEIEGINEEIDFDYDPSTEEMYQELTDMFLGSPSDCVEVPDLDTSVYIQCREEGISAYGSAIAAYKKRQDDRKNNKRIIRKVRPAYYNRGYWHKAGYASTIRVFGEPLVVGESGDLFPEGYDDSSYLDADGNEILDDCKGASGNGYFRYCQTKRYEQSERFNRLMLWIESASEKNLAVHFGSKGKFYCMVQEDRAVCFGDGKTYTTSPIEAKLTKGQVEILTSFARSRLKWTVKNHDSHVVVYYLNNAKRTRFVPVPRPLTVEKGTEVTQGCAHEVCTPITMASESADTGRWGTSTARPVRTSHLTPEALLLPGKTREVNRKRPATAKDESENKGHKLWSFCKRK